MVGAKMFLFVEPTIFYKDLHKSLSPRAPAYQLSQDDNSLGIVLSSPK